MTEWDEIIISQRLDTVKYLSRHLTDRMTSYGRCCDKVIVAKNWKFCPHCGGPLLDGEPVTLRDRISDAEQRGMDEFLGDLDGQDAVADAHFDSGLCVAITKRSKLCRSKHLDGEKMCKRHNETRSAEPLLDF